MRTNGFVPDLPMLKELYVHKDSSVAAIIWRLFVPAIAISSEFLQFLGLLPGTYDTNDLLVLIVSTIIGVTISIV